MNIKWLEEEEKLEETVNLSNIESGSVFCATLNPSGYSSVFLKCYNRIVDLKNPENTWAIHDKFLARNFIKLEATLLLKREK